MTVHQDSGRILQRCVTETIVEIVTIGISQ